MGNIRKSNQYNLTKDDITKLLAKHDPMVFMYLGAPDDEYEGEAELIDNFCRQNPDKITQNELSVKIKYIFVQMFNESCAQEITNNKYLQIADDIIETNYQ